MQGEAWDRLAAFTDTIGNRLAGSPSMEIGIDYLLDFFENEGFARGADAPGDRVYTEAAMVPHWVRGEEWAKLKQPLIGDREWDLTMLGLGGSVGTIGQPTATPSGSIEAEVVVFRSMEEMQANAADVAGRIVLVKEEWAGYRTTVRRSLNVEAAKLGAVAALIKSVGPFSLDSPHTGSTGHPEGQVLSSIPTAALSVEYAEMLLRMYERCSSPAGCLRLELYMEVRATTRPGRICAQSSLAYSKVSLRRRTTSPAPTRPAPRTSARRRGTPSSTSSAPNSRTRSCCSQATSTPGTWVSGRWMTAAACSSRCRSARCSVRAPALVASTLREFLKSRLKQKAAALRAAQHPSAADGALRGLDLGGDGLPGLAPVLGRPPLRARPILRGV